MVMAYIWTGMILIAVLFSFWSGTGGALSQAVLEGAQAGVTLTFSMAGAVCLRRWTGYGKSRPQPHPGALFKPRDRPAVSQCPAGRQSGQSHFCQRLRQSPGPWQCCDTDGNCCHQTHEPIRKTRRGQSRNVPVNCDEHRLDPANTGQCGSGPGRSGVCGAV